MKKKLLALCLSVALIGAIGIGSTLAYLSSQTETVANVFTVGDVGISVTENFQQNSLLMPATGSAQNGTLKNGITKEVYVNADEDSQPTYVRVFIAIPHVLDDKFDAYYNLLHFNYPGDADYNWNWKDTAQKTWNYYEQTIDGVLYDVYAVTYEDTLNAGETTTYPAMNQVYLDSKVTSQVAAALNEQLGTDWKMLVAAQGVQAAGFDDPYTALNAAFGDPTAASFVSPFTDTTDTTADSTTTTDTASANQ